MIIWSFTRSDMERGSTMRRSRGRRKPERSKKTQPRPRTFTESRVKSLPRKGIRRRSE